MNETRPLGTLDIFGAEFENRDYVCQCLKKVYQSFGYDPLQTPAIEYEEVFTGHHGEGEKLLFHIKDAQGKNLVLRYDMTVPFARFAADHPELPRPIKRYQMQMAYRDDAVDKGHFREFMQCDGDIIGCKSLAADADVINLAVAGLKSVGFTNFIIRINHRDIIKGIAEEFGYKNKEDILRIQRALDCADKFGKAQASVNDFVQKLTARNFSLVEIEKINALVFDNFSFEKPEELLKRTNNNSSVYHGLKELQEIVSYLPREALHHCVLDLTLARGADYYTGFILEGVVPNSGVGAVLGGGRYDNLVQNCGGNDVGCVGRAFGLDRICVAMADAEMYPKLFYSKVLIGTSKRPASRQMFEKANILRANGINCDLSFDFFEYEEAVQYAKSRHFSGIIWNDEYTSLHDTSDYCNKVLGIWNGR
ncbi:MAG: HisS family protein [Alphaproteobacteria bacterium]|nr:HisS family protein [Alphaproteobacteria bacterium]